MYRILLVEDDKNIRALIVNYFTKKEQGAFTVDVACDGQSGLEKAYENNYDCLLLDVMLPELDGFEICREMRKNSDVPILFITARTDESDILNGYALGCDDYVIKPFPLPVLYEKVNALIKRSKGLVRSKVFVSGKLSLNQKQRNRHLRRRGGQAHRARIRYFEGADRKQGDHHQPRKADGHGLGLQQRRRREGSRHAYA